MPRPPRQFVITNQISETGSVYLMHWSDMDKRYVWTGDLDKAFIFNWNERSLAFRIAKSIREKYKNTTKTKAAVKAIGGRE